jgi:hypothetical protein
MNKIDSVVSESIALSGSRHLEYPDLAARFSSVYPFDNHTAQNDLPPVDYSSNERIRVKLQETRTEIQIKLQLLGTNRLIEEVDDLEALMSHLPAPEDGQIFSDPFDELDE